MTWEEKENTHKSRSVSRSWEAAGERDAEKLGKMGLVTA